MIDLRSKRFIITGGNGFLGSAVIKKLLDDGVPKENIFVPRSKQYDLRNKEAINRMFNDFTCNIVIHLAAKVGGIGYNMVKPGELFYDNIMMGVQLIEESRKHHVEKFVALGTVCAYPKHTITPFKEEDLWNGYPEETNAPYGLAKKMMLVQSQAYRKQYGFKTIFLLPVNLYGIGDNFNNESSHVIPALIKKVYDAKKLDKKELLVWGDGSASREFLYVDDAAEAIIMATKKYDGVEPVNIGNGKEITIKELVIMICKLMNFKGKIIWDENKPNGQHRRCLDTSRAKEYFGFVARTKLSEGLKKTICWYNNDNKQ